MLRIALGAEFNSEKMFKDVAALASKYKGVQLHTHVAENPVSTPNCCATLEKQQFSVVLCASCLQTTGVCHVP